MTPFILDRAANLTGIACDVLRGPSRARRICVVRHAIMVAMRTRGMSLPAIGRLLDRDHTTILHGLAKAARLARYPAFQRFVEKIA